MEEGSEFGFSRTGKDFAHDLAKNADGTVRRGWRIVWIGRLVRMRWAAAEVVVASGARARFGGSQVGGVAFDPEDHVTSDETHGGVRMSGTIVQEVGDGFHGCLGAFGLLSGDGADGSDHRGVDSASIE